MKLSFRKTAAFIASAALFASLVSCSDEEKSSSQTSGNYLVQDNMGKNANVNADDMPFGATMIDLYSDTDNVPISISYEKRFMTEEQARKISDYISAVDTKDEALLKKTGYEPYLNSLIKDYNCDTIQEYLDSRHDVIEGITGADSTFDYIIINELYAEGDDNSLTGFNELDSRIKEVSPDAEISSRYMIKAELLYSNENGSYSFSTHSGSDTVLYLYTIDGQLYIL